jgi:GMP synthase-like glutamine amidotransferase
MAMQNAIEFLVMKPVAILRHSAGEGPGYFATYLERRSIASVIVGVDRGDPVPRDARAFSGLVFMGGPMSVNDELPWIAQELELIREAVRTDVPVLGHCLGGQLMSKAFGGVVSANPVKEIGWGEVKVADNALARQWFDGLRSFESFHWHGETFTVPPGATRVLENKHCANQAFVLGKHLGMQCHVEMTESLIKAWLRGGREEMDEAKSSPGVNKPAEIEKDLAERVAALNEIAAKIYDRWTEGLSRGS